MTSGSAQPTHTPTPEVLSSGLEAAQAKAVPEGKYGGTIDMHVACNVSHLAFSNGIVHCNGEAPEPLDIRGTLATGRTVRDGGTRYVFDLPENARLARRCAEQVCGRGFQNQLDVPYRRAPYSIRSDKAILEGCDRLSDFQVQVDFSFPLSAFLAIHGSRHYESVSAVPSWHGPGNAEEYAS